MKHVLFEPHVSGLNAIKRQCCTHFPRLANPVKPRCFPLPGAASAALPRVMAPNMLDDDASVGAAAAAGGFAALFDEVALSLLLLRE